MRMTPAIATLAALSAVVLMSCGSPTDRSELASQQVAELRLTTDRDAYTARPLGPPGPYREFAFKLTARLRNDNDVPVYLDRCTPLDSFPMYGFTADSVGPEGLGYNRAWACVGHDSPLVVPPHSTRTDHYTIVGPSAFTHGTGVGLGALEGRLQLVYGLLPCPHADSCFREGANVSSNEFTVRVDSL
jgi:hypothetical protein